MARQVVAFALLAAMGLPLGLCGDGAQTKISNGKPASAGQFPYFAAYFVRNTDPIVRQPKYLVNCGGSLVAPNMVLTAAHCFSPSDKGAFVKVGITSRNDDAAPQIAIKRVINHPKYDMFTNEFDVALWVLERPVEGVPLAKLATQKTRLVRTQKLTAVGFGASATSPTGSKTLQYTTVEFVRRLDCESFYYQMFSFIPRTSMCTASLTRSSICPGDSGSPLITEDGTQVGISSFAPPGSPCGAAGVWNGYTDIRKVRKWIDKTLVEVAAQK